MVFSDFHMLACSRPYLDAGIRFKLGIDFSSGTVMTLRFNPQVEQGTLRQQMSQLGYDEATIQKTSEGDFLVRTRDINSDEKVALIDGLEKGLNSDLTIRDFETVSPVVASEVARNAAIAVLVASIFMILLYRFRL
jgi:preprotein translocase subunit SecF